jgi:aminopeptidase N
MRSAFLLLLLFFITAAQAQVTRYAVKLTPDLDHHVLHGEETITFHHQQGDIQFQKQTGLQISSVTCGNCQATDADETVNIRWSTSGKHSLHVVYTAASHRGITWFPDHAGFDTAFYCEAWMVCDNSPAQRATLNLEIVLPSSNGLTAAGLGKFKKQWKDAEGKHFLFEQTKPVQTYLFSFGVAKFNRSVSGPFVVYTPDTDAHKMAFTKTADAYAFLRSKAGVDLMDSQYTQVFVPDGIEQEAAGLALMPSAYLADLEQRDQAADMTHELAHQWWGVLVGIRSWSDFWLNEGMADFMTDAYLERHQGREAYDREIAAAKEQMDKLRAEGKDRPLHWEGWKDTHGALGPLPYVKGALFLDHLRTELGEERFWPGIKLYTTRNAGRLVDSRDFEHAMEEASGRDLKALFDQMVYH